MRWLRYPFWNAGERRARALVRIAAQLVLYAGLAALLDLAFAGLRRAGPDRLLAHGGSYLVAALLVVFSVWLCARSLDRRPLTELGLRIDARWLLDAGFGTALGAVLMFSIYACESHFGWAEYAPATGDRLELPRAAGISVAVVVFTSVAITEELIFRGYQLTNLAEGLRGRRVSRSSAVLAATLLSSLAFGLAHIANPHAGAHAAGNVALAGAMLATGYLVTGELAVPIGLHLSWNLFQNLFGMPVSGQRRFHYAALFDRVDKGPVWVTGGGFGPEAGMTGLVAMLAGLLFILLYARALEGRFGIHRSLLESGPVS